MTRTAWTALLNNDVYMVYGGPRVGRLAYLQLIYELDKRVSNGMFDPP